MTTLFIVVVQPHPYADEARNWIRFSTRAFIPGLGYVGAILESASRRCDGRVIRIDPYQRVDLSGREPVFLN